MSHLVWVLEFKLRSAIKAARTLNHRTISPVLCKSRCSSALAAFTYIDHSKHRMCAHTDVSNTQRHLCFHMHFPGKHSERPRVLSTPLLVLAWIYPSPTTEPHPLKQGPDPELGQRNTQMSLEHLVPATQRCSQNDWECARDSQTPTWTSSHCRPRQCEHRGK